jgi:hypothetical protein
MAAGVTCKAADTVRVQTLTFDDITKRSGTWLFPPAQPYEKVLLEYTLKCDSRTTQDQYPCGEWDYLTYIVLTDSTGEFDSSERSQVNFVVRGTTPDSFAYSTASSPRFKSYRGTSASRTTEGTWTTIGAGDQSNTAVLNKNGGRALYILRQEELTSAGLNAGPISGLSLRLLDSTGIAKLLTVRLMATQATVIKPPIRDDGFTTVVRRDVPLDDGVIKIPFHQTFNWDGVSNIMIELSCLSVPGTVRLAAGAPLTQGYTDDGSRRALLFGLGDRLIIPADIGAELSSQITIALWAWGNTASLPRNHNALEAFDAQGRRVLNVHLPWSDGTVYWDAGRNGETGPERIQKAATPQEYEGRWHHWAFVKNTSTSTMTIYLDGEVFVEGGGKGLKFEGIKQFIVGSGNAGSYPGLLDEIQIWNTALDQATIKGWMTKKIDYLHPKYENLLAYYDVENVNANGLLRDGSNFGRHARMFGMPVRERLELETLGHLVVSSTSRPQIGLESGNLPASTARVDAKIEQEPKVTSLILFNRPVQPRIYRPSDPDYPAVATDTLNVQEAGWLPIYSESDLKADSFYVAPTKTLKKIQQTYYDPVVQFELGRYITPYGIGLDLGPKGFKWIYDVTDFAPLLRNNVTLSAGNQQELLNMTFVMVKGLPARNVKQIDQVWYERNAQFPAVLNNTALAPKAISLNVDAKTFRFKTVTSGHDFDNPTNCAEFCKRTHTMSVGGTERFAWQVWKECGDNPVYPQGGTWLIDRTGWCPGAPVDLYEFELTPFITGRSVTVDYGIKPDTTAENWGRWEVSGQLIGYGAPNSEVDAEIVDILAPNNWEFYSRMNPICGQPVIVIRNRGAKPLTSLSISATVNGGLPITMPWTGSLGFLEQDTIALPMPEWTIAEGPNTFTAQLTGVAGDAYTANNSMSSAFQSPPVYYPDVTVVLRTNNFANEQYEWELRKIGSGVIKSGSNLASNTLYQDSFKLDNGCYEYRLVNKLGYGLDFWFLRNQLGTGSLQIKSNSKVMKSFNPDFGNTAWIQFLVAPKPTIKTSTDTLYFNSEKPEPTERSFWFTAASDAPLKVDSLNIVSVKNYFTITAVSKQLPATLTKADTVHVTVKFNRADAGTGSASIRMYSNDELTPIKIVRALGNNATSDVEPDNSMQSQLSVTIQPNPMSTSGTLILHPFHASVGVLQVQVVDMLGRPVALLFNGEVEGAEMRIAMPEDLVSGQYFVVVSGRNGGTAIPVLVSR